MYNYIYTAYVYNNTQCFDHASPPHMHIVKPYTGRDYLIDLLVQSLLVSCRCCFFQHVLPCSSFGLLASLVFGVDDRMILI